MNCNNIVLGPRILPSQRSAARSSLGQVPLMTLPPSYGGSGGKSERWRLNIKEESRKTTAEEANRRRMVVCDVLFMQIDTFQFSLPVSYSHLFKKASV